VSQFSEKNFGLVIAYILPGFTVVWGLSFVSPTVDSWLNASQQAAPTVAGLLLVTVASLASGLVVSAIRWAVVDTIHHRTGVPAPDWEFANLQDRLSGFLAIVENHYRYYQCYGNMFIATPMAGAAYLASASCSRAAIACFLLALLCLEAILFLSSRDALQKYYVRAERLLGVSSCPYQRKGSDTMTNGFHPKKSVATTNRAVKKPSAPAKPKPKTPANGEEK
jgi:hypothetical protein